MSEGADDDRSLPSRHVGAQLAAERARQKLELSDIAARTRIPLRHLEAIESGQHAGLPALPYSAGFVKTYANMLGLDGPALSRAFREQVGEERRDHFEPEAYEPVDPSRVPSRLLAMIALGVALLLGMGYLLLRFEGDSSDLARLAADTVQDDRPVPVRPASPPPAAEPGPPPAPTGPITVVASEDVWIKISEREGGRTYFMSVLPAGQSFALPDDVVDPILRTGRPQALKVMIGTTELPAVGEPDRLVRAYSLKRDALVSIVTAQSAPAESGAGEPGAQPAGTTPPASAPGSDAVPPRTRAPAGDPPTASSGGEAGTAGPVAEPEQRVEP